MYDSDKNAFVKYLNATKDKWPKATDHLLRGIVHRAVKGGNVKILSLIIMSGCNINQTEGCGITPLILDKNIEIVKLLLENHAETINLNICHYLNRETIFIWACRVERMRKS